MLPYTSSIDLKVEECLERKFIIFLFEDIGLTDNYYVFFLFFYLIVGTLIVWPSVLCFQIEEKAAELLDILKERKWKDMNDTNHCVGKVHMEW